MFLNKFTNNLITELLRDHRLQAVVPNWIFFFFSSHSLLMCPVHWAVHTTPTQAIVNSGGLPQAP